MFRFISTVETSVLCSNYLAEFNTAQKEADFKQLLSDYPDIRRLLPSQTRTVKKIMTAPFKTLNKIYFKYQAYRDGLSEKMRNKIETRIKKIFNYKSNTATIANFISNPVNGFTINNCVYCDLEKVKGYVVQDNGQRVRKFQTEHVLDKGKCPLLALSLFNFVPSCSICNSSAHKGTKTLGENEANSLILSPTSIENKFNEEVQFTLVLVNPDICDLTMFNGEDDVEIDFKGKFDKYGRTISIFRLKDRYNAEKAEFIKDFIKWRNYPESKLCDMAESQGVSVSEIFEDLFEFSFRRTHNAPMEKCRRDLFLEFMGNTPEDYLSDIMTRNP